MWVLRRYTLEEWLEINRAENDRIWGEGNWVMCSKLGCIHNRKPCFHHREAKFSHG